MKLDDFEQLKEIAAGDGDVNVVVWGETTASAYREITLTKEDLDECRDEDGNLVNELVTEKAQEIAFDVEGMPDVCAQCSGWHQSSGIELGEFEAQDAEDAVRLKS